MKYFRGCGFLCVCSLWPICYLQISNVSPCAVGLLFSSFWYCCACPGKELTVCLGWTSPIFLQMLMLSTAGTFMFNYHGWFPYLGVFPKLHTSLGRRLKFCHILAGMIFPLIVFSLFQELSNMLLRDGCWLKQALALWSTKPGTCHHFCTTPSSKSALLFLLICWLLVMWWLGGEFKAVIFSKFWNLTLLNSGPLSGNNSAGIPNCLFNYVIPPPKAKITRLDFVSDDTAHKIILSASNASC